MPVIEDHVPVVVGDSPTPFGYGASNYRARAYSMGYIKALIDAVGSL